MARLLLLVVFVLWMAWTPGAFAAPPRLGVAVASFFGVYVLLVAVMALWARVVVWRMRGAVDQDRLAAFHKAVFTCRPMIVAWFAVGIFSLGWGHVVYGWFGGGPLRHFELPAALLATAPAVLAWVALWWAGYPIERATREHNALRMLEDGLPVHAPPTMWSHVLSNVRTQLLFTLVPILLIIGARDLVTAVLLKMRIGHQEAAIIQGAAMFLMAALIFVFSPELLRRVLQTSPLPPSPLRSKLEEMCRRHGVRYRQILLWHTEHAVGNAAVMGIIPQVRYVLLSDLLVERLSDEQIEAVFAHELGHVVHRHLMWYGVFIILFTLMLAGPVPWLVEQAMAAISDGRALAVLKRYEELVGMIGGTLAFLGAFGFLSRRIERQADVFAARMVQEMREAGDCGLPIADCGIEISNRKSGTSNSTFQIQSAIRNQELRNLTVGPHGASVFASALERVAAINHMPTRRYRPRSASPLRWMGYLLELGVDFAQSWLHGTIGGRCEFITSLPARPDRTARFDRRMTAIYVTMIVLLVVSAASTAALALQ